MMYITLSVSGPLFLNVKLTYIQKVPDSDLEVARDTYLSVSCNKIPRLEKELRFQTYPCV